MLVDIEVDELTERLDGVERVQVKPLMLQCSPPGLDQGVGERDLGLRDHAPESSGVDEFVNGRSSILYTGVGEQGGGVLRVRNRFAGLEENLQL